ncbi:PQQ-like beta-propeller repeat protein [Flavobacteriaceae bacterium TP-CH-4]|uniref:PQQ-like beta-propeller repeat protein n=1 Tax=Pelagihabitans pacificus TaxID=2696054 RepID=A0A967AT90_9FLAO|nr:PQQ-binding-like beta-propeller repeat protein [Pelagihabitans pacificus]NHF59969.1 PQQ-like beta-propeller repeat protein [Pelagihabitans pacificus]
MSPIKSFLFVLLIVPFASFSQVEMKWNKDLPTEIQWQEVTSLGNLIVSSREELIGIDTETGDISWGKRAFGNLERAAFEELPKSPFFAVTTDNTLHLIDQFSGQEVFNSLNAGLREVASYHFLYDSDAILVSGTDHNGEPLMVSVKMSDATVSWSMSEKFGRIVAANELDNQELLIVTLFNNYKLNATTGAIIWKKSNSKEAEQIDKMGKFGALLKQAAENMSQGMDIQLRYYQPAGSTIFYLGSQKERQSGMTSSAGNTINYTNHYNAYDINDGSLVWDKELQVNGALSQVCFLEEGMLVLPDDGNRTKINLFDYETREGLWGKKGRGIAIKGGVYDYLDSGDGILLVSRTANKDFLNYLDPRTGTITFEKPVKIDGTVVGIVPLANAILYITTESMNILDHQTGTLKWKKSIRTRPSLTAEHQGNIYAFDHSSGLLKVVEKVTGEVRDFSRSELRFEGKESPTNLEVLPDGIFVHSDQNVAKFDFNGALVYHEYYPAPKEAGWKRALLYASSIRAAYIGASSYYVSGALAAAENDVRREDRVAGELVAQIGDAYGELGNAASSYAVAAFKQANARLKATKQGRDFMFIMSKQEKDIVLLKVGKASGKIEGQINLGKDREPIYAVDDITGQVYYRTGDAALTSYQAR